MTVALAGRAVVRGPMRPRTLACTADGVWLWPGTPLTERRGTALVPIPLPHLYQQLAALHGPSVHAAMLARTIARAAACLSRGSVLEADEILAGAPLPPISFDGAALMQAIGKRLDISVPAVGIAGWPSSSPPELFEQLARVHDRKRAIALALEPVFNPVRRVAPANAPFDPTLHPRWPAGQPEGGQFRPRDGGEMVPVQWQSQAARLAARLLARLWRLLRRPPKLAKPGESTPSPAKPARGADDVTPGQQAPENVVRIPRYKHWMINDYYSSSQPECGGLTPREYLKGKSAAERYQFGLAVLRKFGVLQ